MNLQKSMTVAVPLLYLLLLALESRFAARPFQAVRGWRLLGTLFFLMTMAIGAATPWLLPVEWLASHRLLDLSALGLWGIPAGVLTATFLTYWLHRAQHRFDWLWLATHQLHHSPNRVDMWGAFYTHPLSVIVKLAVGTLSGTFLLGLSPLAASAVSLITASLSMFQHWNVRTPRFLGYLIQRPESHCLHHEKNVHARNYSDLPVWDMLFGTFSNPQFFDGQVGFDESASGRVIDMLLMRDVHEPETN